MDKKLLKKCLDETYKELSRLSPEEFKRELKKHKSNNWYSGLIKEMIKARKLEVERFSRINKS